MNRNLMALTAIVLVSAAASAGARVLFKAADRYGYTVPAGDKIYRVTITGFTAGGRCRSWLNGGGTRVDLNSSGVYVEVPGNTRITVTSCDECKQGTNDCKEGSPVGEWPGTGVPAGATAAEATWEIGAGRVRGVGQARAKATEAD